MCSNHSLLFSIAGKLACSRMLHYLLLGCLLLIVYPGAEAQRSCGNGTCEIAGGENCSTCAADCMCAAGQSCIAGLCQVATICGGGDCDAAQRCRLSAPYLIPDPPVIETAGSDVHQGDTFRIVCGFHMATKQLEWPNCDTDTANRIENYRQRIDLSAANRYSGMLDVNGLTVRVAASPAGGLEDFELEHLWYQKETGKVSLVCKVDNMLQPFVQGSEPYLEAAGGLSAGSRVEGREPVTAADLPPRGQGGIGQRQSRASGGSVAGRAAGTTRLPAVQGRSSGSDAVNPALNPQPEVPSAKQRQGAAGASTVAGVQQVEDDSQGFRLRRHCPITITQNRSQL